MKKDVHEKEAEGEAKEEVILAPKTEKDELVSVYNEMKRLGVNSIGDLEVRISRLQ